MTVHTIADITPNGSAVALSATTILAVWVQLTANGTSIRFGDSNVGSTRGAKIATGTSVQIPRCEINQGQYDLSKIFVYGSAGADSVSVTYGN